MISAFKRISDKEMDSADSTDPGDRSQIGRNAHPQIPLLASIHL